MLLLDTHAYVWLLSDLGQLTKGGKALIRENAGQLYISAVTPWEIALLTQRERLKLPRPAEEYIATGSRQHGVQEIPVDGPVAMASVRLPPVHTDPFDRVLVATAIQYKMAILSRDGMLSAYPGVTVRW